MHNSNLKLLFEVLMMIHSRRSLLPVLAIASGHHRVLSCWIRIERGLILVLEPRGGRKLTMGSDGRIYREPRRAYSASAALRHP